MSTAMQENTAMTAKGLEDLLIGGDLACLTAADRVQYYGRVCESLGLNALTKPFEFISLNKKLVLYATRNCTDQLRRVHKVNLKIASREVLEGVYVVTAQARDAQGREDESTGAVSVKGLQGDALANAYMKAETKAKRRVTLSLCGLGMLDESEVETIPHTSLEPAKQIEGKPANGNGHAPQLTAEQEGQIGDCREALPGCSTAEDYLELSKMVKEVKDAAVRRACWGLIKEQAEKKDGLVWNAEASGFTKKQTAAATA